MILGVGDEVRLRSSGARYRVEALLGRGGQGAVFRVAAEGERSVPLALKWYRPAAASTAQHARLERLLALPRPSSEFLWPIEFATAPGRQEWGYVMPLARPGAIPLGKVVKGAPEMPLRELVQSGALVAQAFKRLHGAGYCYADVSLSNVLVDPADGRVQICDNDNVTIDGRPSDVLGTPYFIAPEVVRSEANPSIASDRHSLAVMLFMMLVRQHPLLGARDHEQRVLGEQALLALLGGDPTFVFDPEDEGNRPVPGVHDNLLLLWPALPMAVRRLFTRAFTAGLADPSHGRVTEGEWLESLLRLRGSVQRCPTCGTEQFWDGRPGPSSCAEVTCGVELPVTFRLLGRPRREVVLDEGRTLRRSDLAGSLEVDDPVVAEVVRHPVTKEPALRNRSDASWTVVRADGRPTVPAGAAVLVRNGLEVEIGGRRHRVEGPG